MMFCNGHLHHPPSCPLQSTHQAEPLKSLLCCFFLFFPPSSPLRLCCRMNKTLRADGLLALMVSPFYLHLMSYLNFMTDVLPLPHPENVGENRAQTSRQSLSIIHYCRHAHTHTHTHTHTHILSYAVLHYK